MNKNHKIYRIASIIMVLSISTLGCKPLSNDSQINQEQATGCFTDHLKQAIALNKSRVNEYAAISDDASRKVSRFLILAEKITLAGSLIYDRWARKWQDEGIPVLCADFIDMDQAAPFTKGEVIEQSYVSQKAEKVGDRLNQSWSDNGWNGLKNSVLYEIERIESAPAYHCMLRHLLESIGRSAHLAPQYETVARDQGLRSPRLLMETYLSLQIKTIWLANQLDDMAAPLQADGIPIICQDVPYIPIEVTLDDYGTD